MKLKLWKLKMRLRGIHTVDIAPKSLLIYKLKVKGNSQKSDFEAIKRLNRCWFSGTYVGESDRIEIRYYGNLKMILDKNPLIQSFIVTFYKNIVPGLSFEILFTNE